MNAWSASVTGRAVGVAGGFLGRAWESSYTHKLGAKLSSGLTAALCGSFLLSVEGSRLRLLPEGAGDTGEVGAAGHAKQIGPGDSVYQPGGIVGAALVWLYLLMGRVLGESAVGRFFRSLAASWGGSALAGGRWLLPAAGGLLGLAAGALSAALGSGSAWAVAAAGALLVCGFVLGVSAWYPAAGRSSLVGRVMSWSGLLGRAAAQDPVAAPGTAAMWAGGPAVRIGGAAAAAGAAAGAAAIGVAAIMAFISLSNLEGALVLAGIVVVGCSAVFLLYRPEALLPLIAAFPWLDWAARKALGPGLGGYWDEAFLLGSLVAVLFSAFVLRRSRLRSIPAFLPLLVAIMLALASVVANGVPNGIAQFAIRITFQPFLFYLVASWCPKERRWVKAAVVVFLVGCLLMAAHGLFQYVTNAPMPASWVDTHESIGTRAYSILDNPNGLGNYMLLGTILAVSLTLSRLRPWHRIMSALCALILLGALAVSFSRGAYIGLVVGLVAMVLLAFRPWFGRLAILAVMGVFLVPQRFIDRLLFGFSRYYLTLSQQNGRLYVWRIALYRMADHPWFGVGLGTFGGTSAYVAGYSRLWMDNFYLQLLTEGGLLFLLAFLWLLARAGKGIVASFREQTDPLYRGVAAGAFGAFVAVAVAAIFTSSWETLAVGAGFWFLSGLASSLPAADEPSPELAAARELPVEPGRSGLASSSLAGGTA